MTILMVDNLMILIKSIKFNRTIHISMHIHIGELSIVQFQQLMPFWIIWTFNKKTIDNYILHYWLIKKNWFLTSMSSKVNEERIPITQNWEFEEENLKTDNYGSDDIMRCLFQCCCLLSLNYYFNEYFYYFKFVFIIFFCI